MLFNLIIVLLLTLNILLGESDKKVDILKELEKTFFYGSYQEQLKALELYTSKTLKGEHGSTYLRQLNLLIEQKPSSTQVYIKLIDIIRENQIKSHYQLFHQVLEEEFLKQDFLDKYKKKLVVNALHAIAELKLLKHAEMFSAFFSEETLNEGKVEILQAAVHGMGVFQREEDRQLLLEQYTNITHLRVQEEILLSLSLFKNQQDVDLFKSIIYSEDTRPFLKWIALVSLKEYTDSKLAFDLLKSNLYSDNFDIRSRALYSISFFKKDEVEEILIKASKEDNPQIRYQAVSGLEQYQNKRVDDLLKYKMERDPEVSIRKKAKEILEKRSSIEEKALQKRM